jgi:hypothetical protein
MNPKKNEDRISQILSDPNRVREIIQRGINNALLKHKQAGNSVCGWRDGQVYWVKPENIPIN